MKQYPRDTSYGEQVSLYKDSMTLKNGEWKSEYPSPKESARLPKDKAVVRTNAKLGLVWGNDRLSIEERLEQAKIQTKAARRLCDSIIKATTITEAKEYAEQLKEVL